MKTIRVTPNSSKLSIKLPKRDANHKPKLRRCKAPGCRELFTPVAPYIIWHSVDCAAIIALAKLAKIKAAKLKADRKRHRERREKLKTLNDWISDAQVVFNKWVRTRDIAAGHGCIDCGKPFEPSRPGGSVDAGHFLSRGGNNHLKFDERNCFAQRKNCNRPGGTTRQAFRDGVIDRIGIDAVEALESNQAIHKFTIDECKEIITKYRRKIKALKTD